MDIALIPDSISILGALGWLVAGGVWLFSHYRKTADEQEAKLVKTLLTRVEVLEKEVETSKEKIDALENENRVMKDIILLRTPEDIEWRQQVLSILTRLDPITGGS